MIQDTDFHNTPTQLISRLLGLLPVAHVKEEYGLTGNTEDVFTKIADTNSSEQIYDNTLRNMGLCRQHIYILQHGVKDLSRITKDFWPETPVHVDIYKDDKDSFEVEFIVNLDYDFLIVRNRTADMKAVRYLWPIKVVLKSEILEIRMVVMESRPPKNKVFRFEDRNLDEVTVVRKICESLGVSSPKDVVDITKGIKYLWSSDQIDSTKAERVNRDSTDNSRMNNGRTFKAAYPDDYEVVKNFPLKRMGFLSNTPDLANSFICEPEKGYFGTTRYQDEPTAIDNLIKSILDNN